MLLEFADYIVTELEKFTAAFFEKFLVHRGGIYLILPHADYRIRSSGKTVWPKGQWK